jgi:Skp family chaperone for outer membrane proteins
MLDSRLLCSSAILLTLVTPAAAQDQNVKRYSSAEIDSMLATLRNKVSTEIDAKLNAVRSSLADLDKKLDAYKSSLMTATDKKLDAYKSSLMTATDKKLDAYKSSLITDSDTKLDALKSDLQASTYSQKDIDGKVSAITTDMNNKLDALKSNTYSQKVIDDKLSATTTDTNNKVNDLGQREEAELKALDSRIPTAPWWGGPVLGAILGALSGALTSFGVARYAAGKSEARRRTDAADALIDQYIMIPDKVAAARDLLQNSNRIRRDADKNLVISVGNWYERVADRWLHKRADPTILKDNKMDEILLDFWNSVEALKTAHPPIDFTPQQGHWPALRDFWRMYNSASGATT